MPVGGGGGKGERLEQIGVFGELLYAEHAKIDDSRIPNLSLDEFTFRVRRAAQQAPLEVVFAGFAAGFHHESVSVKRDSREQE